MTVDSSLTETTDQTGTIESQNQGFIYGQNSDVKVSLLVSNSGYRWRSVSNIYKTVHGVERYLFGL